MDYRNFDLLVERAASGFLARVLDSPGGTGAVAFNLPFSNLEIENFLLRVGRRRPAVRRGESSELLAAKTFGAALFKAVFSGEVASCFRNSLGAVRKLGSGLRIRLRLSDGPLTDLPWEYLYNPAVNRFLALSNQTPLVRYLDLPEPILPIAVTTPIRALVMISSPADYPALDVHAEWRRLNASLAARVASSHLAIDRLDDATLTVLQRQLRKERFHIFHFIGHAEFDEQAQEGVLILKDEHGRGHRVGSQYLGMLLHDQPSLRVAILNACEGARTSTHDPFAGSAQTLVQQGIPAVIAMQFEIADDVAGTFAQEFYGALSDGYPIDAALTEARKAIFAAGHDVEWGTPVLYSRAPDGRIFEVEQRPGQRSSETAAATPGVAVLIRDAGVALAHGRYQDALKHLRLAATIDPHAANLEELIDTAEQQRAVGETRMRLRREIGDHLAAANELLRNDDLAAASARVREALKLKSDDVEALALETRIRGASRRQFDSADRQPARSRLSEPDRSESSPVRPPPREELRGDAPPAATNGEEDLLD